MHWTDRYVIVQDLLPGNVVTIEFPMVEYEEQYRLKWKQEDFWPESTDPGTQWTAESNVRSYRFQFRGNTVTDIQPRNQGVGYRLYQRDELKSSEAKLRHIERFVSSRLPSY